MSTSPSSNTVRTLKWETNLKGREKKCIEELSRRIESEGMILNGD